MTGVVCGIYYFVIPKDISLLQFRCHDVIVFETTQLISYLYYKYDIITTICKLFRVYPIIEKVTVLCSYAAVFKVFLTIYCLDASLS